MTRLLVWGLAALLLGGVVHIVTILTLPQFAEHDPWHRVVALGAPESFVALPRPGEGEPVLPGLDPAMMHAVCRFSLADGPVRIRAVLPDTYWSLSLYDRGGLHAYGIDDRATGRKPLDVVVADDTQVAQIRENPPEDFEDIVIVPWPGEDGFVLISVLVPLGSQEALVRKALATAGCRTSPLS